MISIILSIILAMALIVVSLLIYLFVGCIIFEALDRHAWFDYLEIYDIDTKQMTAFIWPIIIILIIIQLIIGFKTLIMNFVPLAMSFLNNVKEFFKDIKEISWLSGSLIYLVCAGIFKKKK